MSLWLEIILKHQARSSLESGSNLPQSLGAATLDIDSPENQRLDSEEGWFYVQKLARDLLNL